MKSSESASARRLFLFLSAAAACVRCIAGIFDWNIGFRISCLIGIMGRKTRRTDSILYDQASGFFFYMTFACLFYVLRANRYRDRPVMLGFYGFMIEIASDSVELAVQFLIFHTVVTPEKITDIAVVAISHTFIVISFFNVLKLYETQSREKQTRRQNEHMLMIVSNLYEETVHLKRR